MSGAAAKGYGEAVDVDVDAAVAGAVVVVVDEVDAMAPAEWFESLTALEAA